MKHSCHTQSVLAKRFIFCDEDYWILSDWSRFRTATLTLARVTPVGKFQQVGRYKSDTVRMEFLSKSFHKTGECFWRPKFPVATTKSEIYSHSVRKPVAPTSCNLLHDRVHAFLLPWTPGGLLKEQNGNRKEAKTEGFGKGRVGAKMIVMWSQN